MGSCITKSLFITKWGAIKDPCLQGSLSRKPCSHPSWLLFPVVDTWGDELFSHLRHPVKTLQNSVLFISTCTLSYVVMEYLIITLKEILWQIEQSRQVFGCIFCFWWKFSNRLENNTKDKERKRWGRNSRILFMTVIWGNFWVTCLLPLSWRAKSTLATWNLWATLNAID